MTAQAIPLQPVPAQQLGVILGGQATTITLRQLSTGLYLDLQVNAVEIVGLVVCENLNRIVRNAYLGFQGDLAFYDNSGAGEDPFYSGLGGRFQLFWLPSTDVPGDDAT